MSSDNQHFREELISLEPVSKELELKFRKEVAKMYIEEISGVRRLGLWAKNLFMLVLGVVLIYNAFLNQPIFLSFAGRLIWGLIGVLVLIVVVFEFRIVLKKKVDLRKDTRTGALIGSASTTIIVFVTIATALLSRDLNQMAILVPMATLTVIIGMLISINYHVRQGELNTLEKLLEVEYRLAALDERIQEIIPDKT
jgi:uncharacterized membrane protein YhaH (DUF805 family)